MFDEIVIIWLILKEYSKLGYYYSGGEMMMDFEDRFVKAEECNQRIRYLIYRLRYRE